MKPRLWFPEDRPCWWCRVVFTAKQRDEVYCSTACGYAGHGRPLTLKAS